MNSIQMAKFHAALEKHFFSLGNNLCTTLRMCNTLQVSAKCDGFPEKMCRTTAQYKAPVALVAVQNHRAASDDLDT